MHGKAGRVMAPSDSAARKVHTIGVIMNGVTGRMGTNQHLHRSIMAIREQGGVKLVSGEVIMPVPVLVGRNAAKLEALSAAAGGARWTTNLDEALADASNSIYFDAQTTDRRAVAVRQAIAAGKHIYCEKPAANSVADAYELYQLAKKAGVKHGVVQDKLWMPGMLKLAALRDQGFFGRVENLDIGFSRAIRCPRNGRRGIIARKMAAESLWICCATGATCWIICLARCARFRAEA
jgi:predicted dehydrogenase